MNKNGNISLFSCVLMVSILLSGCEFSTTYVSSHLTDRAVDYLLAEKKAETSQFDFQSFDLLGDSLALFAVVNDPNLPKEEFDALKDHYQDYIKHTSLFDVVLDESQLASRFAENREIDQSKTIYLDSLTTVAVSDKDISNPMGKFLNTKNFLVFQIDRWPCLNCQEEKLIRMKLRLVHAPSGHIVWTGIAERNNLSEEELGNLLATSKSLCTKLTDIFYDRFRKKWHRKRYKNLALLAK